MDREEPSAPLLAEASFIELEKAIAAQSTALKDQGKLPHTSSRDFPLGPS
jgi:hypothetical protein